MSILATGNSNNNHNRIVELWGALPKIAIKILRIITRHRFAELHLLYGDYASCVFLAHLVKVLVASCDTRVHRVQAMCAYIKHNMNFPIDSFLCKWLLSAWLPYIFKLDSIRSISKVFSSYLLLWHLLNQNASQLLTFPLCYFLN